jgi:hypothetical protein
MNVSDGMKAENITVTQGLTRETAGGKIFGRGKGKKELGSGRHTGTCLPFDSELTTSGAARDQITERF